MLDGMKRNIFRALGVAVLACLCTGLPATPQANEKPNIVVEGNTFLGSGLGVYLGWNGDWHILVRGNHFEGKAEAIRVVNRRAIIEDNVIVDNVIGIRVTDTHEEVWRAEVEEVLLRGNMFEDNELYALHNLTDIPVIGHGNWWGDPEGPRTAVFPTDQAPAWHTEWVLWSLPELAQDSPITLDTSLTAASAGLSRAWAAWPPIPASSVYRRGLTWANGGGEFLIPQSRKEEPSRSVFSNTVLGLLEYTDWLDTPSEGR